MRGRAAVPEALAMHKAVSAGDHEYVTAGDRTAVSPASNRDSNVGTMF